MQTTLMVWLVQCQKSIVAGVEAMSMPAVGMVLTGTKALIRPGRNMFSPVTGWTMASFVCRAFHISSSLTPSGFLPVALKWSSRSMACCSCASVVSSVRMSVISTKWRSRPS